jgi:hypothetical protein|tara:strand:- start:3080 stop:3787 length:708 start_codon:yes stop_codon:yes gene_type:complete
MKPCLIKQPAGVGDVFFLQKVAHHFRSKGSKIIWPLRDDIFWISKYIPDIEWYKVSDDFPGKELYNYAGFGETEEFIFADPSTADRTFNTDPTRIMSAKYGLVGLDHRDWAKYFKFNRNKEREEQLYYMVLGLKDDSEYVYVNDITNTDLRKTSSMSDKSYDYPVVENKIYDGFSLFDWIKVWENAKEIHTQPTAMCFIMDVIDTDSKIFYYPKDERQYQDVIDIFNKVTEYRNA